MSEALNTGLCEGAHAPALRKLNTHGVVVGIPAPTPLPVAWR